MRRDIVKETSFNQYDLFEYADNQEERRREQQSRMSIGQIEVFVMSKEHFTDEEKNILASYTGSGGQKDGNGRGVLDEYYTPAPVAEILVKLSIKHLGADKNISVLEPSVGTGNFLKYLSANALVDCYEVNPVAAKIASVLYPSAVVNNQSFESVFIDERGNKRPFTEKYDLVIGNPPFGEHRGMYKGLGEEPKIGRYEEYFVKRSLDVTKAGGIVAMVLPSGFIRSRMNFAKREIARLGELLEAYRLPSGVFKTTEVGTDLVVFRKAKTDDTRIIEQRSAEISGDGYFASNSQNIVGAQRERLGKYGKEIYIDGNMEEIVKRFEYLSLGASAPVDVVDQETEDVSDDVPEEEKDEFYRRVSSSIKASYIIEPNKDDEIISLSGEMEPQDLELWLNTTATGELSEDFIYRKKIKEVENFTDPKICIMTKSDGVRKFYNNFNYFQGDIYDKLERLENDKSLMSPAQYARQKEGLLKILPAPLKINEIKLAPTDDLLKDITINGLSLREQFLNYCDELPWEAFEGSSYWEIRGYVRGEPVYGKDAARNAIVRTRRRETASALFKKFLLEELSDEEQKIIEDKFNRTRNAVVIPDYAKVPLVSRVYKNFKSEPLQLRPLQLSGIGFLVNKGVGCLAHEVGAGKTLTSIIAVGELLKRGWCKRPLIVAPRNIYHKWIHEISDVLPGVKINALANLGSKFKGDLSSLNIADGTVSVVTVEGFQKIGFKKETYENLTGHLRDVIARVNTTKREKALEESKSQELAGKGARGTSAEFFFEDLGFDHLVLDEAHKYKNIFSSAKMEKGQSNEFRNVQGGGSSTRGVKAYLASQYILDKYGKRGVFLLTATPFTNSPLEYYSMLSLLAKKRLEDSGLINVNSFMTSYMDLKTTFVVKADRTLKEADVIERFKNARSLRRLVGEYFDFKDAEEAGVIRPDKRRKQVVLPPSELQATYMKAAEALFDDKNGGGAIVAITELQNITLSPYISRYFSGGNVDYKSFVENSPKIHFVMEAIKQVKSDNPEVGQVIYMPRGVEYHKLLKEYLIKELNYGPEEVGIISGIENSTDGAIDDMRDRFNSGKVKILIGSDSIKEGIDLQENTTELYALHLPWNPTDLNQIEGRIWRHGNQWKNIRITYPLIENSVDPFIFQKLETKEKRIRDVRDKTADEIDIGEINFEEMKLDLITDPVLRLEAEKTLELSSREKKLSKLKAEHSFMKYTVERLDNLNEEISEKQKQKALHPDYEKYADKAVENLKVKLARHTEKLRGIDMDDFKKRTDALALEIEAQEKTIEAAREHFDKKIEETAKRQASDGKSFMAEKHDCCADVIRQEVENIKRENEGFFVKRKKEPRQKEFPVPETCPKPLPEPSEKYQSGESAATTDAAGFAVSDGASHPAPYRARVFRR